MKRSIALGVGSLLILLAVVVMSGFRAPPSREEGVDVTKGPLFVWSIYDGVLKARRVDVLMSEFAGSATIAELAPESAHVKEGDLLVRFDESAVERDLLKLERDYALAKAEMESLQYAQLPLELSDISLQLLEAQAKYEAEKQYLDDSIQLMKEELVSSREVEKQKKMVSRLASSTKSQGKRFELTRDYLHPSRLERARATLAAAEQELELARQQLRNCSVRAPSEGVAVYSPLHIGTEYRTVRVGDPIYKNQVFMTLPDMSDLLVECHVPEAELSRVEVGKEVVVVPLAYADLRLRGKVEAMGSMAQDLPGRASWQKYFRVVIALSDVDKRLRSGMSVHARILSYHHPEAILAPRLAVWWSDDTPYCRVRTWAGSEVRALDLSWANQSHYEVVDGLVPGEIVLFQ